MNHEERLSDIDINVHGCTQEDIINNRKAGNELVRQAAIRGNKIAQATEWLVAEARAYGIDSTYDEELDDFDV